MKGKGLVVATFDQERRRKAIALKLRSSPFHNITTRIWDGRHVAGKPGTYDGVLVDAISSGIGSWRRNPDARWTTFAEQIPELAARQLQWLDIASSGVKPGGTLVYTVATVTQSETAGVVNAFLASHPEFTVAAVPASSGRREDRRHASALAADSRRRCALYRAADASGDAQQRRLAQRTDARWPELWWSSGSPCSRRSWLVDLSAAEEPTVDLSAYRADSGITVSQTGSQLRVSWPLEDENRPARSRSAAGPAAHPQDGNQPPKTVSSRTRSSKTPTPSPFCWSAPARPRRAARPA